MADQFAFVAHHFRRQLLDEPVQPTVALFDVGWLMLNAPDEIAVVAHHFDQQLLDEPVKLTVVLLDVG